MNILLSFALSFLVGNKMASSTLGEFAATFFAAPSDAVDGLVLKYMNFFNLDFAPRQVFAMHIVLIYLVRKYMLTEPLIKDYIAFFEGLLLTLVYFIISFLLIALTT